MIRKILPLCFAVLVLASCKKDDPKEEVPASSNFSCTDGNYCFARNGASSVSFSGQTTRLNQLAEMTTYMKTANNGSSVTAAQLKEMFSNNDGQGSTYFSDDASDASKQLKSKSFLGTTSQYESWMDDFETDSQSSSPGSNGVAGVVISTSNPSKQYFFNASGFEYTQLIEKGLMGDVFYYQAMETYIQNTLDNNYDNTTVISGKNYTEAEHKFDEAFGYLGIGVDFPESTDGIRFHGKYCNSRDAVLGTNVIADEFYTARAAIVDNDDPTSNVNNIKLEWHRVCAGTAIHYLNAAKNNIDDDALRNHELSEAYAFIGNLLHN
ncbi:MAG: DUF4856 domain-containing protein, partial [Flavobacteriales bacterium]